MWLIEFDAYNQDEEAVETIYVSDVGFTSGTSAVDLTGVGAAYTIPANTSYPARVREGLKVSRSLYRGDTIGGSSIPSFGDIRLANGDGSFDYTRRYTFDGRTVKVVWAESDLSSARLVFDGVMKDALLNENELVLRLYDRQATLDEKLADVYSPFDRSYSFSGVDSVITAPAAASLMGLSAWTIEFWCYPRRGDNSVALAMGDGSSGYWPDKLAIHPAYTSGGTYKGDILVVYDGDIITASVGTRTLLGGWHHIAVTYDGSDIRIYTDGLLRKTRTTTGSPSSVGTQSLVLGAAQISSSYVSYLRGFLNDVRGWSYTRTQDEIQRDMRTRLTGVEVGLEWWYPLDEAPQGITVKTVFDYGPNQLNATVYGTDQKPYSNEIGGPQFEGQQIPLAAGPVFNAQPDLVSPRSGLYAVSSEPVSGLVVRNGGEPVRWQPAQVFDGSADYITIPDSASYDCTTSNGGITWEFMLEPNVVAGTDTPFSYTNGNVHVSFTVDSDGDYVFTVTDNSLNTATVTGPSNYRLVMNATYRVTLVIEPGEGYIAVYINGDLLGTASGLAAHCSPGAGGVVLGRETSPVGNYYQGNMYDVRCWSGDFPKNSPDDWREMLYTRPEMFAYDGSPLLGWWRLGEHGTTMYDWTPSSNNATRATALNYVDSLIYPSQSLGAFWMNGTPDNPPTAGWRYWCPLGESNVNTENAYFYWAHSTDYEPGTGSFTWEFWIRNDEVLTANSFPISKKIAASGTIVGAEGSWHIRTTTGDNIQLILTTNSSTPTCQHPTYKPTTTHLGEWHHVAFVWDATARFMYYYFDGEYVGPQNLTGITAGYNFTNATQPLTLYARTNTGVSSNPFLGAVHEVRLWQSARTAEQIRDNYWRTGFEIMRSEDGASGLTFYYPGSEEINDDYYYTDGYPTNFAPSSTAGVESTKANREMMNLTTGPHPTTAGETIKCLLARRGFSLTNDVDLDSIAAYDSDEGSHEIGWHFRGGVLRDALDALVSPNGFWLYDGNIFVKQLRPPDYHSLLTTTGASGSYGQFPAYSGVDARDRIVSVWMRARKGPANGYAIEQRNHCIIYFDATQTLKVNWDNGVNSTTDSYGNTDYSGFRHYLLNTKTGEFWVDGVPQTPTASSSAATGGSVGTNWYLGRSYLGVPYGGFVYGNLQIWDANLVTMQEAYDSSSLFKDGSERGLLAAFTLREDDSYDSSGVTYMTNSPTAGGASYDMVLSSTEWFASNLYDSPIYLPADATYSQNDETEIRRLGSIVPVVEQRVRYLKNFSRVSRTDMLSTFFWNTSEIRLLDSDGAACRRGSLIASVRHELPNRNPEIVESPYFRQSGAAQACELRSVMYGVQRERYRVVVYDESFSLQVGDVVRLIDTRFDFPASGKNFIVVGIEEDRDNNTFALDVWG